jgi:hypothetical protein
MTKIEQVLDGTAPRIVPTMFILGRLWRGVLRETDTSITSFNEAMSAFIVTPGGTRKQETDARGKLRSALAKTNLSLRSLITGLDMLKATRITFTLEVSFQDKPSVTVSDTINFLHPLHNPEPSQTKH